MLDRTERICKWTLLGVLLLSLVAPVPLILKLDLLHTDYVFEMILFFLLSATCIQSIPGLIGWVMLHRFNEKGKKVLMGTYLTTLAAYGLYSLFLLVTLLFPGTFHIFPLEIVSIFSLFALSAAVFLLQHFWTRYSF